MFHVEHGLNRIKILNKYSLEFFAVDVNDYLFINFIVGKYEKAIFCLGLSSHSVWANSLVEII